MHRTTLILLDHIRSPLKLLREGLEQVSEFLEKMINSVTTPFYIVDPKKHKVIKANSSSGLKKGDICYKSIHNRNKPCSGKDRKCSGEWVYELKKTLQVEQTSSNKNEKEKITETHLYPLRDSEEKVVYITRKKIYF